MRTKLGTAGFAWDGAFAEMGVFPEYSVLKLPDTVSDDAGAFVEPLAVAVHAVKRARLKIGASVAVIGAGPIGLRPAGLPRSGRRQDLRRRAPQGTARAGRKTRRHGRLRSHPDRCRKAIGELTDNLRADWAFDGVGNQASFDTAVKVTGRRAVICIVDSTKPIEVPFIRLWGHEKELVFSSGYEDEFPAAIQYLADGGLRRRGAAHHGPDQGR